MKPIDGRSPWMEAEPLPAPTLEAPLDADVAVVGSGMAGLSAAYEIQLTGRSVAWSSVPADSVGCGP